MPKPPMCTKLIRSTAGLLALALMPHAAAAADTARENQLRSHPSPYLALHDQDPVHWQIWSKAVIETAKRENKLLFLSSGYFSCYWCHVMQRESYRNPEIARLLNAHFLAVKIDRELQPALDSALIEFVQASRGYAGWPLNVFVTPDGYPVFGTVYLPPEQFRNVLEGLQELWSQREPELRASAISGFHRIRSARPPAHRITGTLQAGPYRDRFVEQALQLADMIAGGFGEQNKFPLTPQLLALLEVLEQDPDPELDEFLRLTLSAIADQGLRDHLGGGFFRYCVDPTWQTPHFEKMLYDNALLAELYLRAAPILEAPELVLTAHETLDFLMRQLRAPDGALYASLSAVDDDGSEGGYYLWDGDQLEALLSPEERAVAETVWGLNGPAPFTDGHLPIPSVTNAAAARKLSITVAELKARLASARSKLLAERANRPLPTDTKQLAAWNGLALAAFSLAASNSGGDKYRPVAKAIRDYLVEELWDGTELTRSLAGGSAQGEATLEDYAYTARGLWYWSELQGSGADADIALVRELIEQAWKRFHSAQGWRLSQNLLLPIGSAEPLLSDGPMPSPTAVLLDIARIISQRQRDPRLCSRVLEAARIETDGLRNAPFSYASHITLLMRLE